MSGYTATTAFFELIWDNCIVTKYIATQQFCSYRAFFGLF